MIPTDTFAVSFTVSIWEALYFFIFSNIKTLMKKVILTAVAALTLFATTFAQNTTAPVPMGKMGNKAKTKAADAAAPAQQAGEKAKEMGEGKGHGEGHGKGRDEARSEGKGEGRGGMNALGLSAEQETKFKALNEGHKTAVQTVQKDASLAADAKKAQIDLLKSKYESDVQGVMNTDQFAKWKEMRAKRGEPKGDRREDNDRKEGGRKSDGAATPAPANGTATPAAPAEGMKMKKMKKSN